MYRYIFLFIALVVAGCLSDQEVDEYFEYPVVFSKEKLQQDFMQFREILESLISKYAVIT